MKTKELKSKILNKIKSAKDEHLLKEVYRLLQMESELKSDVYELSNQQNEAIDEGIEQLDNGQYLTSDQANAQVKEWLKKSDGQ